MKEIRQIIEKISNTASLKEKQSILEQHKDNNQLFMLLQMHLNPYRQYYISKLPEERPNALSIEIGGGSQFDKFLHMAGLLVNRTITGHEALATVYDFFKTCDEDERWVFETVLLKKSLNFGTALVNKVKPNWVPEFKLMLADANMPNLEELSYPVIAQTKLDGFRAVYHPLTKSFIGRNGKPIRNKNLELHFKDLIIKNQKYVLDGELYSDTMTFNQISSALNSEDKLLWDIYYCIYDCMPIKDWEKQKCDIIYAYRCNRLLEIAHETFRVVVVGGLLVHNLEEVKKYYEQVLENGYEGIMLKDPNGLYQWKRVSMKSGIMSKYKPCNDFDGKIVGYEEGEGKYVGQLGNFIVEVEGIKNQVKVGSGIKEDQRKEFWEKKDQLIGQWIKLKAFEITEGKESLRFPVFLAIRDSKGD